LQGIELRLKHGEINEIQQLTMKKEQKLFLKWRKSYNSHIHISKSRFSNPNVKFEISKIHTINMNMNRWEKVSYQWGEICITITFLRRNRRKKGKKGMEMAAF